MTQFEWLVIDCDCFSVISVTTVRPESSSSDEDETIGDDTNESMDIDSIDRKE